MPKTENQIKIIETAKKLIELMRAEGFQDNYGCGQINVWSMTDHVVVDCFSDEIEIRGDK